MQFRQKLAYMTLGGVLVLAGHLLPGLVVPPADAQEGLQDAEFDTIRAREVIVTYPDRYAAQARVAERVRTPE